MKKNIYIIICLLAILAAYVAYKMYNKEHTNVAKTKAVASLNATDFFNQFDQNEAEAMALYADKVIEISGEIYSIDLSNNLEPQVVLSTAADNGYIRCGFKTEELEKVKQVREGANLKLKGECKGINAAEELDLLADKDVVLSNCIIID